MLSSRHLWRELQSCTFYCTNEWVELMVTEFRWNVWSVYWRIFSSLWSNDSYTLSKAVLVLIWRTKVTIIQLFTNTCALVSHLIIVSVYLWVRKTGEITFSFCYITHQFEKMWHSSDQNTISTSFCDQMK